MKKYFIIFLFCFFVTSTYAVDFHNVGSKAKFCSYFFDGQYYLILSFQDDNDYRLSPKTVVKFLLNDGSVLKLEGYDGSMSSFSSSFYWGFGFSTGSSSERHYAVFSIERKQIERLKIGIDKVAINTIPYVYKRSKWIGKKGFAQSLYDDYINLKDDFDEETIDDSSN